MLKEKLDVWSSHLSTMIKVMKTQPLKMAIFHLQISFKAKSLLITAVRTKIISNPKGKMSDNPAFRN